MELVLCYNKLGMYCKPCLVMKQTDEVVALERGSCCQRDLIGANIDASMDMGGSIDLNTASSQRYTTVVCLTELRNIFIIITLPSVQSLVEIPSGSTQVTLLA